MWLQGYVNQGRNRQRKGLSQCIRVRVVKEINTPAPEDVASKQLHHECHQAGQADM